MVINRMTSIMGLCLMLLSIPAKSQEMKVMTFNIRLDVASDGLNTWSNRVPLIAEYMEIEMPDIVGMQENLYNQMEDLVNIMPAYQYIGSGRSDGKKGGEFSPVFFRTDRFSLLEQGQFWLSETPDVPGSIGWEAVLPRVVAWAKLLFKNSGDELYVFNTHFSHVSDLARRKSMEFMSEKIREIAGDARVIVTGDFNITKGSELYYDMLAQFKKNNKLENAELIAEEIAGRVKSTFNGFRDDSQDRVIDYIFVNDQFRVLSYQVDQVKENGIFISDHWPVWCKIAIKP